MALEYFSRTSNPNPSMRKRSSRPIGETPTFNSSAAVSNPREENIDGVIWDKCTWISSHECVLEFVHDQRN
jgi:hypothetical protein